MRTKEKLYRLLEEKRGAYISGEYIAGQLGISRAAIWKNIQALRDDGCEIDAVQNRGYCLKRDADLLSAEKIRRLLEDGADPEEQDLSFLKLRTENCVASTNTVLRELASAGEAEGTVLAAGSQTAGRGRAGRSFYSPPDTGLYLSVILRPERWTADRAVRITTMAAVAACEAADELQDAAKKQEEAVFRTDGGEQDPERNTHSEAEEGVSGPRAAVKWVNDIYLDGRKAAGILTEASFGMEDGFLEYAVLGVGFNVYPPEGGFPEEIRDIAGCILREKTADGRNLLAAAFLRRFFAYYLQAKAGGPAARETGYIDAYRRRCFVIGSEVDVLLPGGERRALVLDVDDSCHLLVEYEDGTREALFSGEIRIRPV